MTNTPRRFTFDTDFDAVQKTPDPVPAAPPAPTFSEDELASARAAAHAEGLAAGRGEAEADTERRTAEALETVAMRLQRLLEAEAARVRDYDHGAVSAALTIARRLVPTLARSAALNEIERLVRERLIELGDEPRVVVRVHESLLDALRERLNAGDPGRTLTSRMVLIADPRLAETDCIAEWPDGGAERRLTGMLDELDELARRVLGDAAPTPESAKPEEGR